MRLPGIKNPAFPSETGNGAGSSPPSAAASAGGGSAHGTVGSAPDLLAVIADASSALMHAESSDGVLAALLSAACSFGASRPRAGLWRSESGAYAMSQLGGSGGLVACGTAPASLYAAAEALEQDPALLGPVIPVSNNGRRRGVLDVSAAPPDGAALEALSVLARQAALCLEKLEGSHGAGGEVSLLETFEQWWACPDADALLSAALPEAARLCGADSCALALLNPATGALRLLFSDDLAAVKPDGDLPWRAPNDDRRNGEAIWRVLRTSETLAFRWNPTTEALKVGLLPAGPSEGSYAAHPMTDGGRVLGVLDLYAREPRRFGPAQDALLAHAARTLARILGQRQRDLGRAEADRRQDVLVRLTGTLADQADPKQAAVVLARTAHTLWPSADITYAMLPQMEGGLWSIAALESDRPDDHRHGWSRAGDGFAGWVIQTRQALTVSSAADDPRRGSLDRGQNITAGMWAPMRRGDTLLGLLAVGTTVPGRTFGAEDMESLLLLADQGAVALERSRERHGTQAAFWDAIEAIAGTIDARDGYTHGHSRNVTEYAVAIAQRLELPFPEVQTLRAAALLHDIGKIGIPDHILNKPGPLTPDERTIMESHPEIGYQILLHAPSLQGLLGGVRYHHERPDGKGYPCSLSGERLPLQARILSVADAFDAMTSDRVYRKRMTVERAIGILKEGRGSQWDENCVDLFLAIVTERATPRLQLLAAEDSGRQYLPSIGPDVFGAG